MRFSMSYPHSRRLVFKALSFLFFLLIIQACNDAEQVPPAATNSIVEEQQQAGETYVTTEPATEFAADWSRTNQLVVHTRSEPGDMHPTNANGQIRFIINEYIHAKIVSNDIQNLSVRPDVVKAMPEVSSDGLEIIYELRDEPRWDNGEQLSVEDILFFFKVHRCPLVENPDAKPYFKAIENVVAVAENPRQFKLLMKRPYIQNVSFLAEYPMLQKSFYDPEGALDSYSVTDFEEGNELEADTKLEAWAADFNSSKYGHEIPFIYGLGPYKMVSWETGQVVLEKKQNHWTSQLTEPNIYETTFPEKIIFKVVQDKNATLLEFKKQELDVSITMSTSTLMELQKDEQFSKNYHHAFVDQYTYTYMAFNTRPKANGRLPFFEDKKVRRAVAMLVPVEDVIRLNYFGNAKRIAGPVSPLKKDYNASLTPLEVDVAGAKQLLAEAGWKDSDGDNWLDKTVDGEQVTFSFDLIHFNTPGWTNTATLIADGLKEVGIEAKLVPSGGGQALEKTANHDFDAFLSGWASDSKPDDHTQIWHTSSWVENGSNYTGFGNAESDALIDSINITLDFEKRKALSHRFQKLVYDEQPYVFLVMPLRKTVIHKRFGNAHFYFERPGIILNNLQLLSGSIKDAQPAEQQ